MLHVVIINVVVLFLLSMIMHAYVLGAVSLSVLNSAAYSQSADVVPLPESRKMAHVPPSAPNPGTYIPPSTTIESAFVSHNAASSLKSRKMALAPPSASMWATYIPPSTTNEIADAGHNTAPSLESQKRVLVPPPAPNPMIPASSTNESAFVRHNAAPSQESQKMVLAPPSAPHPSTYIP